MKRFTGIEKAGAAAAAVMAIIALFGYFHPIVSAMGVATNESVDTKITDAIDEIKTLLAARDKRDVEVWINYFDSKVKHKLADESDMVLLDSMLRQRDELLRGTTP